MLEVQKHQDFIEKKITETAYRSHNFNVIPPIIGIIISDQYGNTITVFEYDSKDENDFGPIKSYLSEGEKDLLEIDLISMYLSSFKIFAGQTNIKNLSRLEIYGSNIKAQIYFLFEYIVIVFLNSQTNLTSKERTQVLKYCEDKLTKYKYEFGNFNDAGSRGILRILENKGKNWLKKFNVKYIQAFKNLFLKKHEEIEKSMNEIGLIIQSELYAYLEYIPDEIINNISKEIRNKIQDKLFDFNPTLSKKPEKKMD